MLIEISDLVNAAQLTKIHEILADARFVDGKLTAGEAAARVKANQEATLPPERLQLLYRILMSSIGHHSRLRSFVLPKAVADFIFARYTKGMHYGDHVDDPIMGNQGPRFRSDVSMTLFLNSPEDYGGGELTIRTAFGVEQIKLAAGAAVVYPSASLHRIAEVTWGERRVALTWIQSFVRDAARRELLFELDQARQWLLRTAPDAEQTRFVDRSYANLLRMWAEV